MIPRNRVLIAFVMSPSRDGRRRCRASVNCTTCNVPDEIEHSHWHCVKHNHLRAPTQRLLPRTLRSPQCFQHLPKFSAFTGFSLTCGKSASQVGATRTLRNLQCLQTIFKQPEFRMRQRVAATPVTQNFHKIVIFSGGAFLPAARLQNLKTHILRMPCPYPNLTEQSWMDRPGKAQATARLEEQERKLNEIYNSANHTSKASQQIWEVVVQEAPPNFRMAVQSEEHVVSSKSRQRHQNG